MVNNRSAQTKRCKTLKKKTERTISNLHKEASLLFAKRYLTPAQLVAYLRGFVTEKTLSNWRSDKKGPTFIQIGRQILYPVEEILKWEAREKEKAATAARSAS